MNHITNHQSSQGGGRRISLDTSWLNQGGGGGSDFHDQPAVVDGTSNKAHAACRDKSFLMKTGSIVLRTIRNSNSYEHVAPRRIRKGSYTSGNLRDNETLTAGADDTKSMASFAGRSVKSLQEDLLSLTIARAHHQLLALTRAQLLAMAHQQLLALCNLTQMNTEGVEHTKHEDLFKQTNIDSRYVCLFSCNKLFQQASFGHSDTSVQMLE